MQLLYLSIHTNTQVIKSWHLLLFTCALTSVTFFLLILENAVPSLRPYPSTVPNKEKGQVINVNHKLPCINMLLVVSLSV